MAVFYENRGQEGPAETYFLRALEQADGLAEGFPGDSRFLRLQLTLQDSLATLLGMNVARVKDAEGRLRGWLPLWQQRQKSLPDIPWNRLGVAIIQLDLGKLLTEDGRADEGGEFLRQSMQTTAELVRSHGEEREFREQQAKLQGYVASVLRRAGKLEDAEAAARQAAAGWERLAGDRPDLAELTERRADALVVLADVLVERDRLDEAEQAYRQALDIRDRLYRDWPHVAPYQRERGRSTPAWATWR
jgi:tetratricopeptide (TPR) repeat protein